MRWTASEVSSASAGALESQSEAASDLGGGFGASFLFEPFGQETGLRQCGHYAARAP